MLDISKKSCLGCSSVLCLVKAVERENITLLKDVNLSQPSMLKSFTFVIIQFICLGLIAITAPIFPGNKLLLTVELLGFGIGIWAVFTLVATEFSILRAAFWLVLLVDLLFKLNYEEGMLMARLKGYSEYRQKSYRLIPFIY